MRTSKRCVFVKLDLIRGVGMWVMLSPGDAVILQTLMDSMWDQSVHVRLEQRSVE